MWVFSTLTLFSLLSLRSRLSSRTHQARLPFRSGMARSAVKTNGTRESREASGTWLARGASWPDDGYPRISRGTLLAWLTFDTHASRHPDGTLVPWESRSSSGARRSWWAVTSWRHLRGLPAPARVELPFLVQQLVDSSQNSFLHLLFPALRFQAQHPGLQLGRPKVGEQAERQRAQRQSQQSAAPGARQPSALLSQRHCPGPWRAQIPRAAVAGGCRFAGALRHHPLAS